MATNNLPMNAVLKQDTRTGSSTRGSWYYYVYGRKTLSMRGFCEHLANHNSIYGLDVVQGVMRKIRECLVELVTQGYGVQIDGLGTFYPTIKGKGCNTPEEANAATQIKGVRLRFLPDGSNLDNITSTALRKMVTVHTLGYMQTVDTGKVNKDGKPIKKSFIVPMDIESGDVNVTWNGDSENEGGE